MHIATILDLDWLSRTSTKNILESAFGRDKLMFLLKLVVPLIIITSVLQYLYNWYNTYIEPIYFIWFMVGSLIFDWVTGTLPAWKTNKWETRKALKIIPILFIHLFVIVFLQSLAIRIEKVTEVPELSSTLIGLVTGGTLFVIFVSLVSGLSNAARAGWMKGKVAEYFINKIDRNKLNK